MFVFRSGHAIALAISMTLLTACGGSSNNEAASTQDPDPVTAVLPHSLSLAANSWVVGKSNVTASVIGEHSITNWRHNDQVITTFLHLPQTGELELALTGKVSSGQSTIEVTLGEQTRKVTLNSTTNKSYPVGKFNVTEAGYQHIQLRGISSSSDNFGELTTLSFGGSAAASASFIRDEVYWGRRGPSVHLSYPTPADTDILYFYSELTVPEGNDVIGSYFMANGFADGYFGIQVNSANERRVLFSVWSPYQTDDPSSIPAEDRIVLVRKGEQVVTGEFGNEGSGGQSFLRYNWQTDTTYRFLLKGEPIANNYTQYSAWFFTPETEQWQLIASFNRPKTQRFVERPHSFLENFITHTGDIERKAYYSNQWLMDTSEQWHQVDSARFTADDTARRGNRLDYAGGSNETGFYLQNCGFFSHTTAIDSQWQRQHQSQVPHIALPELP